MSNQRVTGLVMHPDLGPTIETAPLTGFVAMRRPAWRDSVFGPQQVYDESIDDKRVFVVPRQFFLRGSKGLRVFWLWTVDDHRPTTMDVVMALIDLDKADVDRIEVKR